MPAMSTMTINTTMINSSSVSCNLQMPLPPLQLPPILQRSLILAAHPRLGGGVTALEQMEQSSGMAAGLRLRRSEMQVEEADPNQDEKGSISANLNEVRALGSIGKGGILRATTRKPCHETCLATRSGKIVL
jgi:hypothetical protein